MVRLTGFADEISSDLTEQLDVLESESIKFLELRGVWGKNVADFTDAEVTAIGDALSARGMGVSCIGSPIGKIGINDDFATHMVKFDRIMQIAKALHTRLIRVFSFYIPKGEDPASYRDEVMRRMQAMVDAATSEGLLLLHENELDIYGDTGARCVDILSTVNSPHLRAIFDAANFVASGERPYEDCWGPIQPYLEYLHIKDYARDQKRVVPPGEGDAGLRHIVASLKHMNYQGFASLEPHLSAAGRMAGFSGPDMFKLAVQKFKGLLDEAGLSWS